MKVWWGVGGRDVSGRQADLAPDFSSNSPHPSQPLVLSQFLLSGSPEPENFRFSPSAPPAPPSSSQAGRAVQSQGGGGFPGPPVWTQGKLQSV